MSLIRRTFCSTATHSSLPAVSRGTQLRQALSFAKWTYLVTMGGSGAVSGVFFSQLNEEDKARPWHTQLKDATLSAAFGAYVGIIAPPLMLAIDLDKDSTTIKGKFRWN